MRKLILNVHLYGGLLCFSYLLIFGISSLAFNHPFAFTKSEGTVRQWEEHVELADLPRITPETPANQRVAIKTRANESIRKALDLFGYQSPWKDSYWIDANTYHARLGHPGKRYEVDVHLDKNLAVVNETPGNVFDIFRALHGFRGTMPGSAFVSSWAWYTELCVFVVLFAAASGIYLWTRRKNERRIGMIFLGSAVVISLALMFYITLHG